MTVEKPYHERVMSCKQHQNGFAYCGGAHPPLCPECTAEGYKIEQDGYGLFAGFKVTKE